MVKDKFENFSSTKTGEWLKIIFLGLISFISVFGIYNTFSNIHLVALLNHINSGQEKLANYGIIALFVITMIVLQGINFKKKSLFNKFFILIGLGGVIVAMVAIAAMYTTNIIYPLVSMIIIGTTLYMLKIVFDTIGVIGLFFWGGLFALIMVGVVQYNIVSKDFPTLFTLGELLMVIIIWIGTINPRVKGNLFKIGTRDNVDISNEGGGIESDDGED